MDQVTRCVIVGLLFIAMVHMMVIVFKANRSASEDARREVPYRERGPIMITLIEIISKAAAVSRTKPFLLYGSLLGYVRNKDLICYDFDVDVAIKRSEYQALLDAANIVIDAYPEYVIKTTSFLGWRQFEVVHCATEINADIFEFVQNGDTYRRNVPSWYSKYFLKEARVSYPIDWIDNLQQIELKGHEIFIPNKPDQLLATYYGPNYITPDHKCNASCDQCVKIL